MMSTILGLFSFSLYIINTLIICIPVFLFSLLKFIISPLIKLKFLDTILNYFVSLWCSINTLIINITTPTNIHIHNNESYSLKHWYLVIANHQSWVDILVLQKVFNKKIPFLKFFLKQELIWVPIIGIAWWALDFPFMQRYSKEYLKKNPHKKGKDFETTKKACKKFEHIPTSIMNFAEGTRFTKEKQKRQNSSYQHLLKPKSGGIGIVCSLLGEYIDSVIDVTIVYPHGRPTFWSFMCGQVKEIQVYVQKRNLESELIGDMSQQDTRVAIQQWLNQIWQEKDTFIEEKLNSNVSDQT